jgi:hypothetical protein
MFARINPDRSGSEPFVTPMMQDWSAVLGLLHATHESRNITMETFRLDCTSTLPEDNEPWWNEEDVLYFPRCIPSNITFDEGILRWMSKIRECPFLHFASIKHIALDFTFEVASSLASDNGHGPVHLADFADLTKWDYRWLQNFPSLSNLSLLFDPILIASLEEGSIKLYEPRDVVVEQFNRTPIELQEMVSVRLEEMAEIFRQRPEVPKVECFVVCWKKPKGGKMRWEEYLEKSSLDKPPTGTDSSRGSQFLAVNGDMLGIVPVNVFSRSL